MWVNWRHGHCLSPDGGSGRYCRVRCVLEVFPTERTEVVDPGDSLPELWLEWPDEPLRRALPTMQYADWRPGAETGDVIHLGAG